MQLKTFDLNEKYTRKQIFEIDKFKIIAFTWGLICGVLIMILLLIAEQKITYNF